MKRLPVHFATGGRTVCGAPIAGAKTTLIYVKVACQDCWHAITRAARTARTKGGMDMPRKAKKKAAKKGAR